MHSGIVQWSAAHMIMRAPDLRVPFSTYHDMCQPSVDKLWCDDPV